MEPLIGASNKASVTEATDANFGEAVIAASMGQPVVVAFGSNRSAQFASLVASLAGAAGKQGSRVRVARLDTDKSLQVTSQLGIQAIPSVLAFFQGRPVDGFSGFQPDGRLDAFIARLSGGDGGGGENAVDMLLAEGRKALMAGDAGRAKVAFTTCLQAKADDPAALAGLVRCLLLENNLTGARETLDRIPPEGRADKDVAAAEAALSLAEESAGAGDATALAAALDASPHDLGLRFELASALLAAGDYPAATDHLLAIIRAEREWNEGAARKRLLALFETLGPEHPVAARGRQDLSSLLFA